MLSSLWKGLMLSSGSDSRAEIPASLDQGEVLLNNPKQVAGFMVTPSLLGCR